MTTRLFLPVLLILLLAAGVAAFVRGLPGDPPPLPAVTPVGGVELLYARPFAVDVPFVHQWRAERPTVASGWVVVLSVDPDLVHPRQAAEPILFVGDQPAERVNFGIPSGHVVAIVPATGGVLPDLTRAPIYFGAPGLPEQVNAARATAELKAARARGIAAPSSQVLQSVQQSQVRFHDDWELHAFCSDLVERWSPEETDLIAGLRVQPLGR